MVRKMTTPGFIFMRLCAPVPVFALWSEVLCIVTGHRYLRIRRS